MTRGGKSERLADRRNVIEHGGAEQESEAPASGASSLFGMAGHNDDRQIRPEAADTRRQQSVVGAIAVTENYIGAIQVVRILYRHVMTFAGEDAAE
jgi:hypothetical protein